MLRRFYLSSVLFLLHMVSPGEATNRDESEKFLKEGRKLIALGQFPAALTSINSAIDADSTFYQSFYGRATVYFAMGRTRAALADLDTVLELKSDFVAARLQRGKTLIKMGELKKAREDFECVQRTDPRNSDASGNLLLIEEMMSLLKIVQKSVEDADCETVEELATRGIQSMPFSASLYRLRANCYKIDGKREKAIADLRTLSKLSPSDVTNVHKEVAGLLYESGEIEESLSQIRQCLKVDADYKPCKQEYKRLRKMSKLWTEMRQRASDSDWSACLAVAGNILEAERNVASVRGKVHVEECKCHREAGDLSAALAACALAMEDLPEADHAEVLCERAEVHIAQEEWDEATSDFQEALRLDEESVRAKEGVEKIKKMRKLSRDYYKILGVSRSASKREITKAYRKLAQQWHPDNFSGDEEKKKAERKFIEIASAKEVLTDEEKRRQFDSGVDPLDTESQSGHGHHHHPFHQGFPHGFKFESGGYTFHF